MSKITVHNWKQVANEGPAFEFIPPVYHITYWEVPKWWYKGDRTVYTSCARVDVNDATSVYIDGTTPLMQITLDWDEDNTIEFEDVRDIRRILICAKDNIGAINRDESDVYIDIEMLQGNLYKVRYDNYFGPDVTEPLQADLKPVWVNGNNGPFYSDPIPFITGTYVGGVEPVTYEYRHKEQVKEDDEWTTPTDFFPQTNTPTEKTISLDGRSRAKRIHIETKATDAEGTVVYNNGPYLTLDNPVPVITEGPALSSFNQYVVGETVVGFAGAYTGGTEGTSARCKWQWRTSTDVPYESDVWVTNVEPLQEIRSSPIPAGMVQARLLYQVIEPNTSTGSGNRNTNKSTKGYTVTDPPGDPDPSTSWGAVIVYVNGEEYNTFVGAPLNVRVDEPINLEVVWDGDATGTTLWSQRAGGSAQLDDATSATPVVTLTGLGATTLTVTLTDPNGTANPPSISKVISFWAYAGR